MERSCLTFPFGLKRSTLVRQVAWSALLAFPIGLAWASTPREIPAKVDACVQATMVQYNVPGAAVAVALDNQIVYEQGYGVKNRETGGVVDVQTLFRTGSIQKMMTAAAVLAQKDRGLLRLDDPVTALIPELQFAGRFPADKILIQQLLTHTAAVPDLGELSCHSDDNTLSEWAGTLGDVYLYAPAGSFWNYTNAGYSLAGLVAERAAGIPYRRVMRDMVWDPAGMSRTVFSPAEALAAGNYAFGHYSDETGTYIYSPDAYECWWGAPAGDAFTTAGDLTRWAMTLMDQGGRVLSPESAAALQSAQVSLHELPGMNYGYGVFVEKWNGTKILYHGGAVPGWSSHLVWIPDSKFAVAVTGNNWAGFSEATNCIIRELLGLERPLYPDLTTDPQTWRRYQGIYLIRDEEGNLIPAAVVIKGKQLFVGFSEEGGSDVSWIEAKQLYLDTFFIDFDGNGTVTNSLETVTFIETKPPGSPRTMWIRNRSYVGDRVVTVNPNFSNPFPKSILELRKGKLSRSPKAVPPFFELPSPPVDRTKK